MKYLVVYQAKLGTAAWSTGNIEIDTAQPLGSEDLRTVRELICQQWRENGLPRPIAVADVLFLNIIPLPVGGP